MKFNTLDKRKLTSSLQQENADKLIKTKFLLDYPNKNKTIKIIKNTIFK